MWCRYFEEFALRAERLFKLDMPYNLSASMKETQILQQSLFNDPQEPVAALKRSDAAQL